MLGEVENFTTWHLLWSFANSLLKIIKIDWSGFLVIVRQSWHVFLNHSVQHRKHWSWYLYTAGQHFMQHVSTSLHETHVGRCRVQVLTVCDRVHKPITELFTSSQQARLDETHHAVIYIRTFLSCNDCQCWFPFHRSVFLLTTHDTLGLHWSSNGKHWRFDQKQWQIQSKPCIMAILKRFFQVAGSTWSESNLNTYYILHWWVELSQVIKRSPKKNCLRLWLWDLLLQSRCPQPTESKLWQRNNLDK